MLSPTSRPGKGKYVKKTFVIAEKIVGPDGQVVLSKSESKWAGVDANQDTRKDPGKLVEGTYKFYNDGGKFLKAAYLRPRGTQTAYRDINHDGVFTNADTWSTPDGGTMIDTGDFGIYIHRGGAANTWSAGCQTLPPADHKKFFKLLDRNQSDYYYVLVRL